MLRLASAVGLLPSLFALKQGGLRLSSASASASTQHHAEKSETQGKKVVGRRATTNDPEVDRIRREGPLPYYDFLANLKEIRMDAHQRKALLPLQKLHQSLIDIESSPPDPSSTTAQQRTGLWQSVTSLFSSSSSSTPTQQDLAASGANPLARIPIEQRPRGLYMYGDVGCGKTFIMDMFYECCPSQPKHRVHFHSFMLDVHRRIHRWRVNRRSASEDDPIPPLVAELAAEARILCFDEFQVTDIADAMILHRIFKGLIDDHGVVTVSTSNRPPTDLYKNGLNRGSFLPFIDFLQKRCIVHNLNSGIDYRLSTGAGANASVFRTPINADTTLALDSLFAELAHHKPAAHKQIKIKGLARQLQVPRAARGVARFTFSELCGQPHSAADYLALAGHFHTLVLDQIPQMTLNEKVEARRFITLIDALYEHKVKFICSAAASPDQLFVAGSSPADNISNFAASEEEVFAFSRAVSRLIEMQSSEYLEAAHVKVQSE